MKRSDRSPRRPAVPSSPKRPRYLAASVATLLASLWLGSPAPVSAQSATWIGGTDDNWVTSSLENNWSTGPGMFPGSTVGTTNTDTAMFGSLPGSNPLYDVNVNSTLNIGSIVFTNQDYTISATNGSSLLLTGGGSITSISSAPETVNAPLVIEGTNGTYSIINNNLSPANFMTIGGAISGGTAGNTVLTLSGVNPGVNFVSGAISNGLATTFGITVSMAEDSNNNGLGTWLLTGANTYTGPTTINSGTLALGAGGSISNSSVVLSSGGIFDISNAGNQTIQDLSGNGGVINLGNNTLTAGTSNSTTFAGAMVGSGGFTKQGTGTLVLSGFNSYSGPTTINAGTLAMGATNALSGSTALALTASGATFDLNGHNSMIGSLSGVAGSFVNNSSSTAANLTVGTATPDTTFAGVIENTGGGKIFLNEQGAGTLALSGANTFTGSVALNGGTLAISNDGNLGASSNNVTFDSGTLETTASFATNRSFAFLNAGSGTFSPDANTTFTVGGTIGGSGSLVMAGAGTLVLTGVNNFIGGTTVNTGTLQLGDGTDAAALVGSTGAGGGNGGVAVTVNNSTTMTVLANATVTGGVGGSGGQVGGTGGNAVSLSSGRTVTNGGTITGGGGGSAASEGGGGGIAVNIGSEGALSNSGNIAGGNGAANLMHGGNGGIAVYFSSGGTLSNSGNITGGVGGSGGQGGGNGGVAVNFSNGGALTNSGTIAGGAGSLGRAGGQAGWGVSFTGGGTLMNLSGGNISGGVMATDNAIYNITLQAGSTITGGLDLGTNTGSTLTLTDNGSGGTQNYSAAVDSTAFNGSLIKSGTGAWVLDQAFNYSGTTTVNAGTLQIGTGLLGNGGINPSSPVIIGPAGTLALNPANPSQVFNNSITNAGEINLNPIGGFYLTMSGAISGNGGLNHLGQGDTYLSGASTYTGPTTVSAGNLSAGVATNALNTAGPFGVNSAMTVGTGSAFASLFLDDFNVTIGTLSGNANGFISDDGGSVGTLTIGSGVTSPATSSTYAGVIGDSLPNLTDAPERGVLALVKVGAGTQILTGQNIFSGGTTVNAGTLQLGDGIHSASLIGSDGLYDSSGLGGNPGGLSVTVNGGAIFQVLANASVTGGRGGSEFSSGNGGTGGTAVVVNGSNGIATLNNGGTINGGRGGEAADAVGGAGGAGVSVMNGGSVTNSGTIGGGQGGSGSTSGASGFGVSFTGGGTLVNLRGGSISGGVMATDNAIYNVTLLAGSSITGGLNLGTNTGSTLTLTDNGSGGTQVYSVAVDSTTFSGSLIKTGIGTWILDQPMNYTGGTTISAGSLQISTQAQLGQGVNLSFTGALSNLTGVGSSPIPAGNLSLAIQTYAGTPTPANFTALQAAQTNYNTAITTAEGNGTLPVLQITGATTLDGGGSSPGATSAAPLNLSYNQAGGIVVAPGGSLTFQNYAGTNGGAIAVNSGALLDLRGGGNASTGYTLSFTGNSAVNGFAGAIYNLGTLSASNVTFSGNTNNGNAGQGGAIDTDGTLSLSNATFSGNSAKDGNGGAIFSAGGTLSLSNAIFSGNSAEFNGGAIFNSAGAVSVSNATFSGNNAGQGGAIFCQAGGGVSVSNTTFSGNSARNGGAIIILTGGGSQSFSNCTFSGNSANIGGAIYSPFGAAVSLITGAGQTSLFAGNTANGAANSLEMNNGSKLNVQTDNAGLLDMRDPMSGTGGAITESGGGVWALGGSNTFAFSGISNTFAVNGGTLHLYGAGEVSDPTAANPNATVAAGSISLAGSGSSFTLASGATLAAGGNNSITTDGTIALAAGSTLQGGSASQSLGGATPFNEAGGATSLTLTAGGGITLGGTVNVAALTSADTFTLNASLGGAGGLNKTGSGTVVLTGNNTYTGGTTVNAGTLLVNNTSGSGSGTGTGQVIVTNGGTLGGTGTIAGPVTLNNGATILGGSATTVGTLTLGSLTFSLGSMYAANVATGAGNASELFVNGSAALNGATLSLNALSTPNQNNYILLETTATLSGVFNLSGALPGGYTLIYTSDEVELSKNSATIGTPITGTPTYSSIITGGSTPFTFTVANTGPTGGSNLNATATAGTNTTGSAGPITVAPQSTSGAVSGLSFNGATIGANQTGTFTVSDPNATNNPQTGTVAVNVYGHANPINQSGTSLSLGYIHQGYAGAVSSSNSVTVQNGNSTAYIVNLAGSAPASGDLSLTSLTGIAPGATGSISATLAPGQTAGPINQPLTYTYADSSNLPGASSNLGQTTITVTGQVYTGQGVWNTNGSGSWGTFASWTTLGGAPGLDPNFTIGDTATFGSGATSVAPTVSLNGVSPSVSAVTFNNASESYTIAQGTGGTLIFNNGSSAATIAVQSGSHTISAPVQLNSNLQVTTSAAANQLLVSGVIGQSGGAKSLTLQGPGTLTLTGANTYSGGTTISGGTLVLGNGSAAGASLGSGAVTISSGTLNLDIASGGTINNAITDNSHVVTAGTSANSFTIGSAISGTGDFTASGANTVTLTGANAYNGNTNVSGGILTVGTSTAASDVGGTVNLSNGAALSLANVSGASFANNVSGNGALNLNSTNPLTVSGTLSNGTTGTLALNQNGRGATTLATGGMDSYTGATTINAGDFVVNGTLSKSTVTVNAGGTLSGTGDIAGTANVLAKGILAPGTPSTPGLLTVGTLSLNATAVSDFRLGAMSAVNDEVASNSLTLGGTLNVTELAGFGAGIYPLFTYNGALTNNGFSSIAAAGSYSTALYVSSTSATQGTVDLLVAAGTAQYWDGAGPANNGKINGGSGTWNTTTTDWTNSTGTTNAAWQSGSAVFAGTAGTVSLGSPVSARGLIFETAGYTIGGSSTLTLSGTSPTITALGSATISAPIAGTTGLVDNGPGVVALANPSNTYSGGTTVAGNLQIGTTTAAGSIGSGTVSINNGGNLSLTNIQNGTLTNNVTNNVGGLGTLTVNVLGIDTISGALTDGAAGQLALTQNGLSITILANAGNTYSGPTTISTGILDVGTLTAAGSIGAASQVSVGSGTALVVVNVPGNAFSNSVSDASGGFVVFVPANNLTVSGVISGAGSVYAVSGNPSSGLPCTVPLGATGSLTLTGNNTYTGATAILSGTMQIGNGSTGSISPSSLVTTFPLSTLALDLPSGTNFANSVTDNGQVTATGSTNYTLSGAISGIGGVSKTGTGTVTMTGANSYFGATTVSGGTLVAANKTGSATGLGAVSVNSGGTFGGSGTVSAATALNSGGDIFPGVGNSVAGTTLHLASMTWNGGGAVTMDAGTSVSDEVALSGALSKGTSGTYTIDLLNEGIPTTTKENLTLMTFASTTFAQTNFTLELPAGVTGTLVETKTSLSIDNLEATVTMKTTMLAANVSSETSSSSSSSTSDTMSADFVTASVGADVSAASFSDASQSIGDTGVVTLSPTPEPGSAFLLALGFGTLLGWRRRRHR